MTAVSVAAPNVAVDRRSSHGASRRARPGARGPRHRSSPAPEPRSGGSRSRWSTIPSRPGHGCLEAADRGVGRRAEDAVGRRERRPGRRRDRGDRGGGAGSRARPCRGRRGSGPASRCPDDAPAAGAPGSRGGEPSRRRARRARGDQEQPEPRPTRAQSRAAERGSRVTAAEPTSRRPPLRGRRSSVGPRPARPTSTCRPSIANRIAGSDGGRVAEARPAVRRPRIHAARNAAPNASPAPIVSTTATRRDRDGLVQLRHDPDGPRTVGHKHGRPVRPRAAGGPLGRARGRDRARRGRRRSP